jgi:sec-independent protein translocase protein TatC
VSEPDDYTEPQLTDDTPPPPPREKAMSFWEHLEELRGTIIKSVIAFVLAATIVGYFLKEFQDFLMWPFRHVQANYPAMAMDLGTTTIVEAFNVVIQMCLMGGLIMALPFILFFIGQFVAPALTDKERKLILPMAFYATLLFLAGCTFSFLVLVPSTIRVSVELNQMFGFVLRWTPGSYYNLLMWLVLGVGAAFEFPLVIVLLVWMGIMTTAFLRKYRRHAIVVIFIMAAIVTPTPDPINQTLFALPMYALFEIAIIAARRVEKKREARLKAT